MSLTLAEGFHFGGLRKRITSGRPRAERDYPAEVERDLDRFAIREAAGRLRLALDAPTYAGAMDRVEEAYTALEGRL